jgi:Caspase domain
MSGKFALIIGNTEYIDPGLSQLTAPSKDTEDFARILKGKELCAFEDVKILFNEPASSVIESIDEFFDQRKPDDLLVLYFSGHGVRDEIGSLYLAVKNTIRTRLRSTAIRTDYLREAMDQSRSRRQVLILDCCNSGAFPQGTKAEVGGPMGMTRAFQGYGRFVLTASDATQFAWEGNKVIGQTENSLFTHFLVKGLEGEADSDGDGTITVDELYDYAYEEISRVTPNQTPTKSASKQEGEIVLRQITRLEQIKPISLPDELIEATEDSRTFVREGAVQQLEKLLSGKNLGLARSAREVLVRMEGNDDSRRVVQAATKALEPIRQAVESARQKAEEERLVAEKAEAERTAREEAERIAALKAEEEHLAPEKAEQEFIANAKLETERLDAEKGEADRKAKEEAERKALEKAEPIPAKQAKEAPFGAKTLTKLQTMIPPRVLYTGLAVLLLIGLAVLARSYSLRNMSPGTTPTLSATEAKTVSINTPLGETLPATNTIPVAPPPEKTNTPRPVSTASTEAPVSIPVTETSVSIAASRAYLYRGPDVAFGLAVQIAYPRGEKVTVIARNPSGLWFLCEAADGNQGWLYSDWLDVNFDPVVIPTASYIPVLSPTEKPGGGGGPQPTCVPPFCN